MEIELAPNLKPAEIGTCVLSTWPCLYRQAVRYDWLGVLLVASPQRKSMSRNNRKGWCST